jgi:hypothetical protein
MVINNGCTKQGKIDANMAQLSWNQLAESNENRNLNVLWNSFAKIMDAKYLCFLNNDIRITDNFLSDTVEVFEKEPEVGLVIHVTNHPKYLKAEESLKYKVLETAMCQGWDFSIRSELYPEINTKRMSIFGGDDYIFAKLVKEGWKVAFVLSSPIIHFKEKTREINPLIGEIQRDDASEFMKIIQEENLAIVPNTVTMKVCGKYCDKQLEKRWIYENNKT